MGTFIGFSHPRNPGLLTKIAMWLDDSDVSHVFMAYEDVDWKCTMIVQIDEFGFRLVPMSKFIKKNVIKDMVLMDLNHGDFESGLARVARDYVGEMYDFKGFFGMGLALLFKRLFKGIKRRIRNPMASKETVICSEGAVLALQYGNCPKSEQLIPDSTSPQKLKEFLTGLYR